jgi:hypothetical protein
MILRTDNYINGKTGEEVGSITPIFDDEGKPILMAAPVGFRGSTTIGMKVDGQPQPYAVHFPIDAKNIVDAFENFIKFRDIEIESMKSEAIKREMAGGPKIEFFIPQI